MTKINFDPVHIQSLINGWLQCIELILKCRCSGLQHTQCQLLTANFSVMIILFINMNLWHTVRFSLVHFRLESPLKVWKVWTGATATSSCWQCSHCWCTQRMTRAASPSPHWRDIAESIQHQVVLIQTDVPRQRYGGWRSQGRNGHCFAATWRARHGDRGYWHLDWALRCCWSCTCSPQERDADFCHQWPSTCCLLLATQATLGCQSGTSQNGNEGARYYSWRDQLRGHYGLSTVLDWKYSHFLSVIAKPAHHSPLTTSHLLSS